jgi:hypothetical protein
MIVPIVYCNLAFSIACFTLLNRFARTSGERFLTREEVLILITYNNIELILVNNFLWWRSGGKSIHIAKV